jgi:lipid II:glycine glycyltransferase (peptidoglycan interpeptide bridge formation enzyme)
MVTERQLTTVDGQQFFENVCKLAQEEKTIFYRLEFDIPKEEVRPRISSLLSTGYQKAFEEMQPEHTLILDLTKSEEEILAQMKPKGRYNIKIGSKNNLKLLSSNKKGELLENFYKLYRETAQRQKITFRGKAYFEKLLDKLGRKEYAQVYNVTTEIEGVQKTLAATVIVFSNDKAIYLFGASSSEYRNLMAPYFMQWAIIKEAKRKGCKKYDFFGIAPNDDENHPWAGITRFKKQFGGYEVQILGSYDLVFRPLEYKFFKMAETLRRR